MKTLWTDITPARVHFRDLFLHLVFILSLIAVHLEGSYLAFARVGWTIQAILYVLDIRFALYAFFFHCSFFNPAGFLTNALFTVKHAHLAFALTVMVRLLSGDIFNDIFRSRFFLKYYLPVFGVILIGVINYLRLGDGLKALLIPANLAFVLSMFIFFSNIFLSLDLVERLSVLEKSVKFFLFGILLQVGASLLPGWDFIPLWKTEVVHNNHLGMLVVIGLWYGLYFFGHPVRKFSHFLSTAVLVCLFATLLATCSRTAWISFLLVVPYWLSKARKSGVCERGLKWVPPLGAAFLLITVALCFSNESIRARVVKLPEILNPAYWQYTIQDHQNFGFLGIFRLRDLHTLKDIMFERSWLGTGFMTQVVDFHGFYFMLLGATGILGFSLFVYFLFRIIQRLRQAIISPISEGRESTLAAVSLCVVFSWMLSLIMESYFLQFFVWLPILTGLVYIETMIGNQRAEQSFVTSSNSEPASWEGTHGIS